MTPGQNERLEGIAFNAKIMDSSLETLPERVESQVAALQEVRQSILQGIEEGSELPLEFEEALRYAVRYLYRTGQPDSGADLSEHLRNDLECQRRKAREGDWLPTADEQLQLVQGLVEQGSRLASHDKTPAFQANSRSDRPFEIMDPYDVWYNKYGFLLTGTETYGTYV